MQAVSRLVPATGQGQSASAAPAAATTGGGSAAPAAPATEGGRPATPAAARVHSLADCAQALWAQLSPSQRVEVRVRARTKLVVGTACSGTDCAIQCLEHLHSFTGWSFNHAFSCEVDERKRSWILENYSSLPALFSDVALLGTGDAFNHVTGRTEAVPGVDLLVVGFVCKSVSVEYRDRGNSRTCVSDGTGQTGGDVPRRLQVRGDVPSQVCHLRERRGFAQAFVGRRATDLGSASRLQQAGVHLPACCG